MQIHRLKAVFNSTRGNAPGMECRETKRPREDAERAKNAGIGRKEVLLKGVYDHLLIGSIYWLLVVRFSLFFSVTFCRHKK